MARTVRSALSPVRVDLSETVGSLLRKFQKQQRAVRQECKAGHDAWQQVSKTMAARRHGIRAHKPRPK